MNVLKEIVRYKLFENGIIYAIDVDAKFFIVDADCNRQNVDSTDDYLTFTENPDYIRSSQDSAGYYIKGNTILKMPLKFNKVSSNNIALSIDSVTNREMFVKFPEETQLLQDWFEGNIYHIQDQYWCNDTEIDFRLIDVNEGKVLWTIRQPDVDKPYGYNGLTNIKKILGIYKEYLWLQLPDSRILVLNVHDGSILHELSHEYFIVHERGSFFDCKDGTIQIFFYNLYAKYSLDLMKFTEELDLGDPEIFQVTSMTSKPADRYIYYTAKLNDVSMISNAYGIFDTYQRKIIYQGEQIDRDGYFNKEPQVNEKIFTILDSNGNLIIHRFKDILS